uniref:Ovule protein n=1 Tax=Caenorhabditis tropicalis TaxID=1561998 RepID=A0A1I7UNM2_9PELO
MNGFPSISSKLFCERIKQIGSSLPTNPGYVHRRFPYTTQWNLLDENLLLLQEGPPDFLFFSFLFLF